MKKSFQSCIGITLALLILISAMPLSGLASPENAPEDCVYLSDIEWESWKMFGGTSNDANPPYKPSRNSNEAGGTLTIAGVEYKKGLRTHPGTTYDAEFVYNIEEYKAKTFAATVGKDSLGGVGNVKFLVLVDGVLKAERPC